MEYYKKNRKQIDEIAYVLLFLVVTWIFFKYIFYYVSPFIFGYIISLVLNPFVIILNKKLKINKAIASFLSCIIFVVLIIFFCKTILSRVIMEGKYFFANMPFYTQEFMIKLEQFKLKYNHVISIIPKDMKQNIYECVQKKLTTFLSQSGSVVKIIPELFLNIIVTMIAAFFFVKDKILIRKFCQYIVPKKILVTFGQLKKGCLQGLIAYIKAEFIMMSVTATICTIGFCIIKYPYALFLGLVSAIVDALPIFGTGFIIWPWAAYCFLNENFNRAIILLITYLSTRMMRHILSPKLIGKQIGVHPLLMLAAIYIGLKIFGLLGVIFGPIMIITGKIILEDYSVKN